MFKGDVFIMNIVSTMAGLLGIMLASYLSFRCWIYQRALVKEIKKNEKAIKLVESQKIFIETLKCCHNCSNSEGVYYYASCSRLKDCCFRIDSISGAYTKRYLWENGADEI